MGPSPIHRLSGLAIALSLSCALATSAVASASLTGELLPTVTVKARPLVVVETSPFAKVQAPGVATEVPGVATVEAPPITPTEVPTSPVATPSPPSVGTPVPVSPGSPTSSGGSTTGAPETSSQAAASAHVASTGAGVGAPTGAAATSGAGAQRGAGATPAVDATRRSPHAAARRSRRARTSAAGPADGRLARAARATAPLTGPSVAPPARSTVRKSPRHASAGNALERIGRDIPFPVPVPDWSKPIILLLLVLAVGFAARSQLAAARARRLKRQRAGLIRDVGAMQAALVPVIPERLGGLSVSVAYRPADGPAAGGDFYDVFALAPGKVAIVVGDVAGHGPDALKQAALTRYTLRAYLQAGLEPRAVLGLAGSVLAEPAEMQFATVVVAIHDGASGRLTYACAGHPPPMAIGFDTPEPLTVCCSAPIGCDLPTGRRQTTISLPAGGEVCFFSDGLPEARTADGLLGRDRLAEIVDELDAPHSADALLQRVRAEALATPDDMLACVIGAPPGAPAPAGPIEELEVDAETLHGARVGAFLQACGVQAAHVSSLLSRAADVVEQSATALLCIERPRAGGPVVAVLPGIAAAAPPAAPGQARGSDESSLALAQGR
ncbi:MAG TPA: SpoIIE family protein phosphatase [Solirubrobacteraceae bacterium]|nr:SpoIIE family protein phosphatase [Solirubrobacteraceae bacterium]